MCNFAYVCPDKLTITLNFCADIMIPRILQNRWKTEEIQLQNVLRFKHDIMVFLRYGSRTGNIPIYTKC